MIVQIDRSFEKDIESLKRKKLFGQIFLMIEGVEKSPNIESIIGIKKLKGYKNNYRIRIGDYRAGLIIKGGIVIFTRFLHRKDIYKRFP
jgi:mRNA interferase RelE/StbE